MEAWYAIQVDTMSIKANRVLATHRRLFFAEKKVEDQVLGYMVDGKDKKRKQR